MLSSGKPSTLASIDRRLARSSSSRRRCRRRAVRSAPSVTWKRGSPSSSRDTITQEPAIDRRRHRWQAGVTLKLEARALRARRVDRPPSRRGGERAECERRARAGRTTCLPWCRSHFRRRQTQEPARRCCTSCHVLPGRGVRQAGSATTAAASVDAIAMHERWRRIGWRSVSFDHCASAAAIVGERRRTISMTLPRLRELCLVHAGRHRADSVGRRSGVQGRWQDVLRRLHRGRAGIVMSFKCDRRDVRRRCASARASSRRRTWRARSGWRSNGGTRSTTASSNRWSTQRTRWSRQKLSEEDAGCAGMRTSRNGPARKSQRRARRE